MKKKGRVLKLRNDTRWLRRRARKMLPKSHPRPPPPAPAASSKPSPVQIGDYALSTFGGKILIASRAGEALETTEEKLNAALRHFFNREF